MATDDPALMCRVYQAVVEAVADAPDAPGVTAAEVAQRSGLDVDAVVVGMEELAACTIVKLLRTSDPAATVAAPIEHLAVRPSVARSAQAGSGTSKL